MDGWGCEVSAADDLEKIMTDHMALVICREKLAEEWRKVPGSNVIGTHAYYTLSQIEAGKMDKSPCIVAMMKLMLEGFDRVMELKSKAATEPNPNLGVSIDRASAGQLRHLAHSWAGQAALAAAGKARGLAWHIQNRRSKSRENFKRKFLEELEKAVSP